MEMKDAIEKKIIQHLKPIYFEIENISFRHNVPKGSETHFRIEIVSNIFQGVPLLKRHRLVQEHLKDELSSIIACSLHVHTPKEWDERNHIKTPAPTCRGGS